MNPMNLNAIDKKLLLALQQNGRATHVELANSLGIHVSTVAKKMQLLKNSGIIQIRALPNPYKLGYDAHAVIAIEANHNCIDQICAILDANFNVNLIVTTFGKFDILAMVFYPTWANVLEFVSTCISPIDGILNVETYFVKEIRKRYFGFPVSVKPGIKIDEIDQQMIERLSENGRITAQLLARALGISLPTCLKRLSSLLAEKIIEIRAVPIQSYSGYLAYAFMLLRVKATELDAVCDTLRNYRDIFMILTLYNGFDLLVGINATAPDKLYQFIKRDILAINGIINGTTIIRAEVKKRYYGQYVAPDEAHP